MGGPARAGVFSNGLAFLGVETLQDICLCILEYMLSLSTGPRSFWLVVVMEPEEITDSCGRFRGVTPPMMIRPSERVN